MLGFSHISSPLAKHWREDHLSPKDYRFRRLCNTFYIRLLTYNRCLYNFSNGARRLFVQGVGTLGASGISVQQLGQRW